MEKIGLFDFTTNFCTDKVDLREHAAFSSYYPKYLINRVLSMSPKTCHLAMFMSQLDNIPDEQHFHFLNTEVDRDDIFFNYYKRNDDIPEKTINCVQEYFQCSLSRALEYVRMMSEKQLDTILEVYKRRDAKPKRRKVKK
jgi:hypothetical protein